MWLGKGEHRSKLKLVLLHIGKEGETCRQRETSQTGKCQPWKQNNSLGYWVTLGHLISISLSSNAGLNSFFLPPPALFLPTVVLPSWGVWAQLLVESCSKLAKKLIWAKNNFFFAGFLIQISSLIYFAAEPAQQIKELLLKAWLVTHPCWTTAAGEWNVPYPQTHLACAPTAASSWPPPSPWQRISGGEKSSAMFFQSMASLLRWKMAFGRMAEPTILTLEKKSPLPQLRAQPFLVALRAAAALAGM